MIRVLLLTAGAVLAIATPPTPVLATAPTFHLRLVRSDPVGDSTVASPPKAIRLWFSEEPQVKLSMLTLTSPDGGAVELGAVRTEGPDPLLLMADVKGTMASGRYLVRWRTASRDGHPVTGEFGFSVTATDPE